MGRKRAGKVGKLGKVGRMKRISLLCVCAVQLFETLRPNDEV